jgi:hypothetical protein
MQSAPASPNVRYASDSDGPSAKCEMSQRARNGLEQPQQISPLFNHLVGAKHESGRNFMTDRLRGLEVDDELELGRLLDR